jgi:hypothetical protein
VRVPSNLKKMKQLLELGVFGKEGLASDHLCEDAFDGLDVDPNGVMLRSEKCHGSHVPESDNLIGVALKRNGEGAIEAQISNLEDPLVLVD